MRSALKVLHRWLALVTGIPLTLIAVSGAVTGLEGPVAAAHATRVVPGARPLPLDSLGALAIAASGGGSVAAVSPGRAADQAIGFEISNGERTTDLLLNPYTGAPVEADRSGESLQRTLQKIHRFHTSLLAGNRGKAVVGVVTLAALGLVLTGLILWWRDRQWRIQWSASWKRITFDLHHALGIVASSILLLLTATGAWIAYADTINPLLERLDRTPPAAGAQPAFVPPDSGATMISLDSMVALAHTVVPGAPVLLVVRPTDAPTVIALRYPEDHTPGGRSRVYLDGYRGTVLQYVNTRTSGWGSRLIQRQRPLHTGDTFGPVSQLVWALAALVLASQAVTGILMWWNGRRARRATLVRQSSS